jgi:hypothetical protein
MFDELYERVRFIVDKQRHEHGRRNSIPGTSLIITWFD